MNYSMVSKLFSLLAMGTIIPTYASQQDYLYPFKRTMQANITIKNKVDKDTWWIGGFVKPYVLVRVTKPGQLPAISLNGQQKNFVYIDGFGNMLPLGLYRWSEFFDKTAQQWQEESQRNTVRHVPEMSAYNIKKHQFVRQSDNAEWVPGRHNPNPFNTQDISGLVDMNNPIIPATIIPTVQQTTTPTQTFPVPAVTMPTAPVSILDTVTQLTIPAQDSSIKEQEKNIEYISFLTCNELHEKFYTQWSKNTPEKQQKFTVMPYDERSQNFNAFLAKFSKFIDVFVFQEHGSLALPATFYEQFYIINSPDGYLCAAFKKATCTVLQADFLSIKGGEGKGILSVIIETNDAAKRKIGCIDVHLPGSAAEDIQKNQEVAVAQIREYITDKTANFNLYFGHSPLIGWIGGGDFNIDAKFGTNLQQVSKLLEMTLVGAPGSMSAQQFYTALNPKGTKVWLDYIFYSSILTPKGTVYEPPFAAAEQRLITHGNLIAQNIFSDSGRGYFSDHIAVAVKFELPAVKKESEEEAKVNASQTT